MYCSASGAKAAYLAQIRLLLEALNGALCPCHRHGSETALADQLQGGCAVDQPIAGHQQILELSDTGILWRHRRQICQGLTVSLQHDCIDAVHLGQLAERKGEVPGVSRVDHEDLVAPFMQGLVDAAVIAPGRLHHHPGDRVRAQETVEPLPVRCGVLKPAVNTIDMNVEVLLAAPRCRRLPLSCPSFLVL